MNTCKIRIKIRAILVIICVIIFLKTSLGFSELNPANTTADWPQWRGPNRDGVSKENGILKHWPESGPKSLWRIPIGEGFSGMVVSDGKLFTMGDEGDFQLLLCFNALSGKELWRYETGANFINGWGNGPRSTPVVDNTTVFAVSTQGLVHAVNVATGQAIWTRDLVEEYGSQIPGYGYSASPLIDGDKLFVEAGGKEGFAFVALNKSTSELVWHSQTDEAAYSSPLAVTINQTRQIIFLSAGGLSSVSPEDGRLFWQHSWNARCPQTGIPVNSITPLFIAPNKIFLSGGFGTITGAEVVQIKKQQEEFIAETIWVNNEMNNLLNPSLHFNNQIYGFDDKNLKCIEVLTGKEKWTTRGYDRGSLIAADGHLIVLGEKGKLALIEATPEAYKETTSAQILSQQCWTSPSLANGKLYIRNHEELFCLDLTDK